ncbi:VanZ family protein [Clostridium sp. JN-9]|uniref:VanZ family protein n=1 Tax=Clostridium sp. JN-9 TaxID=2507159 RepID=UPI000FFE1B25|nr:VanZ family protein [Clostridium sp. JN-9]QAT38847.1 VanZ family protein [Clostridium sp. JN-9]
MKKIIKWILFAAWMIVIFNFSSMPAEASNENSRYVIYIFNLLGLNLNSILGNMANFAVRKAAHFTEYFILYLFAYNALTDCYDKRKCLWISLIIVFLYASTDEIHQIFVPGRSGRFRDVLIDTSGGTLGMIIKGFNCHIKKTSVK